MDDAGRELVAEKESSGEKNYTIDNSQIRARAVENFNKLSQEEMQALAFPVETAENAALEKDKENANNKKILYGNIIGFIFFTLMYGFIYSKFVQGYNNFDNNILFGSFVFLWALYGVVWWFKDRAKNVGYNVLDLFSKCFVGIFFWAYFTKVIVL